MQRMADRWNESRHHAGPWADPEPSLCMPAYQMLFPVFLGQRVPPETLASTLAELDRCLQLLEDKFLKDRSRRIYLRSLSFSPSTPPHALTLLRILKAQRSEAARNMNNPQTQESTSKLIRSWLYKFTTPSPKS